MDILNSLGTDCDSMEVAKYIKAANDELISEVRNVFEASRTPENVLDLSSTDLRGLGGQHFGGNYIFRKSKNLFKINNLFLGQSNSGINKSRKFIYFFVTPFFLYKYSSDSRNVTKFVIKI